ncbi:MAG: hypothetical protein JRI97_09320 [Deltaproteobacteria bacterium]|nr:hypothetical protein [Deltaproteobacteria bacterium]
MKKLTFVLAFFACISLAQAGGETTLTLSDGSVIRGEVVGFENGAYVVETGAMGTVRVDREKVEVIRRGGPAPAAAPAGGAAGLNGAAGPADVAEMIRRNQAAMGTAMGLKNDPAFQKVLEDPELMRAVQEGDMATLLSDERFMNLLSHPAVKQIESQLENPAP